MPERPRANLVGLRDFEYFVEFDLHQFIAALFCAVKGQRLCRSELEFIVVGEEFQVTPQVAYCEWFFFCHAFNLSNPPNCGGYVAAPGPGYPVYRSRFING